MPDMNNEFVPSLTLDPTGAAAAAAEAEKKEAEIEQNIEKPDISQLSEAEQKMVNDFAQKIDISDTNAVLQYGAAAQKNISDFSSSTLNSVKTKDMGEVGGMLADLVVELKGFDYDPDEKRGFLGLFKKATNQIASLKAQYDKAEANVDKIVEALENHQVTLLKDVAMLDKMY